MDENIIQTLQKGFINETITGDDKYLPRILSNDPNRHEKVLTTILDELEICDEFLFSAAFLTDSGFRVLQEEFKKLQKKNIKGTIIVSQYQDFTEPKALRELLSFKNIELRIVPESEGKLHTKGYIFRRGAEYTIIIGSSNLTGTALCTNLEWNVKLYSKQSGSYFKAVLDEFNHVFDHSVIVDEEFLSEYELEYDKNETIRLQAQQKQEDSAIIKPNHMQLEALDQIQVVRQMGSDRGLVISATGTGKTILSALDVQTFKPKKFLFVVHRETIAKEAERAYRKVLGNIHSSFVLGGSVQKSDYVFAMVQTLSKDEVLSQFARDEFDYIVVDEAHRCAASSYQKVMNYFKPKFWLGMTATPERSDDPGKVYEIFHHEIAYEIRLADAMKEEMVCPFHYYGIKDIEIDGSPIDENTDFNSLICDERVSYIIEKSKEYGFSGKRVKGLIFTSRKEEAKELSNKFNALGFHTIALTGEDNDSVRERSIERLQQDAINDSLDYIFTVDIFNEGVDIPLVNQIIMLRPTQSNIIFVQQLGRGLRKAKRKDYLVVIDFIGNYEKNFMIPMALSGSKKYNKDNDRKLVQMGMTALYGESTVYFDEVAEKRIYDAIDRANYSDSKILKDAYKEVKGKLGKIPTIAEFEKYGSIDLLRIIQNHTYRCYHYFLEKVDKEYQNPFNDMEDKYLRFVSEFYLCGKRPHELEFLNLCLNQSSHLLASFREIMKTKYPNIKYDQCVENNIVNQFTLQYFISDNLKKYSGVYFIESDGLGDYHLTKYFKEALLHPEFRTMLKQIVEIGLNRNKEIYGKRYKDTSLTLYEKYTVIDVIRLLNWKKDEVPLNISGYRYDETTKTYPIFVTYEKPEDISDTIKYQDKFESPNVFVDISKSNRNENSPDVQHFKNYLKEHTHVLLFVRKNKNDEGSKEFYFLGETYVDQSPMKQVRVGGEDAVEIIHHLDVPVRQDIYDYLTH